MREYKIIAFDMDGTLLDSAKRITEESLEAINKAKEKGKIIAISTGRNFVELESYFDILKDVDYIIGISGGLIMDLKKREFIYRKPMDMDVVKELFARTKNDDAMIHIHSDKSIVQTDKVSNMAKYSMGVYQNLFNEITLKTDNIASFCIENETPVYKFNFYCQNPEQREEIKSRVSDLDMTIAFAETASLECSAKGISKGAGLKYIANLCNVSIEDTIAVGDADNDIEILKTAGLSIAMGNSNDNIKAMADVIVADNDHGGCAQAIYEYLLTND